MKAKLGFREKTAALLPLMLLPAPALAADGTAGIDTGDTAFMLIATCMVILMTPAIAFFYGGMVRARNVLNTMMQCIIVMGLVSLQFIIIGYSLAFGPDVWHITGNLNWAFFTDVGFAPNAAYAPTIPHALYALFQMAFALITAGIISGSFVERMKFKAFVIFILLWTTFAYDPVAHWVWGAGGWLHDIGILDFAGGTVIHILSGVSGLTVALMIGKRAGYGRVPMIPHNMPLIMIGMTFLWFGWFGFNAGSALGANGIAANALVATQVAAGCGMIAWTSCEWKISGKPTTLGAASGALAGLVGITPGAGFVPMWSSIIIGLLAGMICYYAVAVLKQKLGYDDSLDAFGIHGVSGIFGALITGVFSSADVNPAGSDGLIFGNPGQLLIQLEGVVSVILFAVVITFIIVKIVSLFTRIRADEGEQIVGMDTIEHGERGYAYMDFLGGSSFYHPSGLGHDKN